MRTPKHDGVKGIKVDNATHGVTRPVIHNGILPGQPENNSRRYTAVGANGVHLGQR